MSIKLSNENKRILNSMYKICVQIHHVIFANYFDKKGKNGKYVYAMANDAFTTVESICLLIDKPAINQCGVLVRMLIEQVSIFVILVNHPELQDAYVEHYQYKAEIIDLKLDDQKREICKHYNLDINTINPLTYLDYGWIGEKNVKKFKEADMIKFAGFKDTVSWKEKLFDKMGHSSFTLVSFLKSHDIPVINNMVEIMCKLFDHLCCNFHKYSGFNFDFNDKDLFNEEFIPLYEKYYL